MQLDGEQVRPTAQEATVQDRHFIRSLTLLERGGRAGHLVCGHAEAGDFISVQEDDRPVVHQVRGNQHQPGREVGGIQVKPRPEVIGCDGVG